MNFIQEKNHREINKKRGQVVIGRFRARLKFLTAHSQVARMSNTHTEGAGSIFSERFLFAAFKIDENFWYFYARNTMVILFSIQISLNFLQKSKKRQNLHKKITFN